MSKDSSSNEAKPSTQDEAEIPDTDLDNVAGGLFKNRDNFGESQFEQNNR